MDENDTFRILRRKPYDEVVQLLESLPKSSPVFHLGTAVFESKKHELVRFYEKIRCLEKNGWSFEEFVLESEKRQILSAIDEYNKNNTFPLELVERAKEFFPNARFIQASIELE